MKTREFIKNVENLGFEVEDFPRMLYVQMDGTRYVLVSKFSQNLFKISCLIDEINPKGRLALLKLLIEYVETPIEEREEPKKYYLRLPNYLYESSSYLNYNTRNKTYCFFGGNEFGESQTKFAQEEIDNLPNQEFIKTLIKEEV